MTTESHTPDLAARPLVEIDDERVDRIEEGLFAEIAADRRTRRGRRTRVWAVGGAAAALVAVAAVIAPGVGGIVAGTATNEAAVAPSTEGGGAAVSDATTSKESLSAASDAVGGSEAAREIITTASATVVVDDITAAIASITDAAASRDGYVESMNVGQSGVVMPIDPMTGAATDTTVPYAPTSDSAWISVRVPADALDSLIDQLSGLGEVTASSVNRQDVTEITVDLQARVDAAQTSVDRMSELLAQASNLTDLIAAEAALAERQANLESYQQQLAYYDSQVAMSTLTITLTEPADSVAADPAGFGDGLAAGWNGLIATLNGIVIALGFLLPWIAVLGVIGLVVWGVVTLVRRRGRSPRS